MTEGAIALAVADYVEAVLPAGTPVYLGDVDPVRSAVPHVTAMVTGIAPVGPPEPAFDTVSRVLDGGARQSVDVEVLVEAYGADAIDWCRRVAVAWLARGGPAATLRATGAQPYQVDRVLEVSAFVDTATEPRAQVIVRCYAPWTSPDGLDLSAGDTEIVDVSLDLEGRGTISVTVADLYLALDDGLYLALDDAEPLLLEA